MGGVGVAIWVIGIVRQALFSPEDIPLLQWIFDTGGGDTAIQVTREDDTFSAHGSRGAVLIVIVGFLLATLGAIVNALVSGGVKLLKSAAWRAADEKEKR
jgi:hypothetical protein